MDAERVRELAAGIAHDYNNLLTSIICGAELALNTLAFDHPARAALAIVADSGEQAAGLTRQLMAYAGINPFAASRVDLSALVSSVIDSLSGSIRQSVQFRLDLAVGLPPAQADSSQIEQLVRALVTNAVEAIGESMAGVVSIRTGAVRIDHPLTGDHSAVSLPSSGNYLRLEVTDTGCGMSEFVRNRIFDPFFSTQISGKRPGLAAVAGIVRAHRGAITVQTAPRSGSTFNIYLPESKMEIEGRSGAKDPGCR